jgi:hypothetical protein
MDELYDDLHQDIQLQTTLHQLIHEACDPATLQEALATVLDHQMLDIKLEFDNRVQTLTTQGIGQIDTALQTQIPAQIQSFVDDGIHQIDTVICGTIDQAIETILLQATRSDRPTQPPTRTQFPLLPHNARSEV